MFIHFICILTVERNIFGSFFDLVLYITVSTQSVIARATLDPYNVLVSYVFPVAHNGGFLTSRTEENVYSKDQTQQLQTLPVKIFLRGNWFRKVNLNEV